MKGVFIYIENIMVLRKNIIFKHIGKISILFAKLNIGGLKVSANNTVLG